MPGNSLTPLSASLIERALKGPDGSFGAEAHYFAQLDSTNDIARQLASKGAPHGTLVVADEQTAGRGRMGRRWLASANSTLLMTLILRPADLPPDEVYRLVMACGLAVCESH